MPKQTKLWENIYWSSCPYCGESPTQCYSALKNGHPINSEKVRCPKCKTTGSITLPTIVIEEDYMDVSVRWNDCKLNIGKKGELIGFI